MATAPSSRPTRVAEMRVLDDDGRPCPPGEPGELHYRSPSMFRGYLGELFDIAESGVTPAERLLELYNGPWQGDAGKVFEAFAY